jgi:hypothetical protein
MSEPELVLALQKANATLKDFQKHHKEFVLPIWNT